MIRAILCYILFAYFVFTAIEYVSMQRHYNPGVCHALGKRLHTAPWNIFHKPGWYLACGEDLGL